MPRFRRLASHFIIPGTNNCEGPRFVFDLEADGLHDATKVHCIVIADLDSDEITEYGPKQIPAALKHLKRARYLVGHNICNFDLPLLHCLFNWTPAPGCRVVDTMIASRLILPNVDDIDDKAAAMGDPKMGKMRGRYSIEAWGMRLGITKVGADIEDWSKHTPEMQERCVTDTVTSKALWQFLQPDGYPAEALALEHRVSAVCNRITTDGLPFDIKVAEQRRQQWTTRRAELGAQLSQQFPDTNLNSRKQLGARLEKLGWIPEERTEKTKQPKITDEVLETIPAIFPEFAGLAEYDILRRRLAQLSDGDEAWSKHVDVDGRIHGGLVHIGTPHSRAKHLSPNIAQVPNPKRGKPFATECRSLFRPNNGWVFVLCDQAGLQDRAFAHYLAEFDAGTYAKAFLNDLDPHWKTAADLDLIANGIALDKQNKVHAVIRENSKSFRYAFLFGAGHARAGHIIANCIRTVNQIDTGNGLQKKFFGDATSPNEAALKRAGKQALDKFIAGTPGLARLRAKLKDHATRYGWLPGLDDRRVPCGAQYTALNFQVTSAEAVITKRWLVRVFDELQQKFKYGWDGDVVITLWVHDEIACCCRPEIADQVGEIMVRHAKEPGEFYKFKVPLDAEYKIGRSWAGEPVDTSNTSSAKTGSDSDAGHAVGNSRRKSDSRVSHGIGSHSQVHRDNSVQLAVASEISGTAGNGIDHAQHGRPHLADKALCPFHDDRNPSMQLYADGHYHCFACGAHGNIDELPETIPAPTTDAPRTDTLKRSLELWNAAKSIRGTLAERYLIETRGLDPTILPDIDTVLRFHPRCPFNKDKHPCLIALFRDIETDEAAGIHRIALTTDAKKIDRMMLGSWPQPRAIKLRPTGKKLIVGEGIETTIAGGMRIREAAALWAMGSAIAIGRLPLVAGVNKLMILVDRDKNNVGMSNADTCAARWSGAKRMCVLLCPQQNDTDFNDLIRKKRS